jgi:hypothetical protein
MTVFVSGRAATPATVNPALFSPAFEPFSSELFTPIVGTESKKTPEAIAAESKLEAERLTRFAEVLLQNRREVTLTATALLDVLTACDELELISLNPDPRLLESDQEAGTRYTLNAKFAGGFKIVSRATTKESAEIKDLAEALRKGFAESDGDSPDCFSPRHCLRYTNNGKTYLAIICLECQQAYLCELGNDKNRADLLMARSPKKTFDAIFSKHGLIVAP